MTDTPEAPNSNKRIWMRTKFDLEGIGGAAAALLVGILLGWIWSPLFWIGFIAAIAILMATRTQKRVAPTLANLVVAPCDGVVHSVAKALPPTELRLEGGEWLRVRISSSPFGTNPIYSSLTGEITSIIMEEPDSSVFTASYPEAAGLAVAHINLSSLGKHIGCTISTGGLGPRLDITFEAGDPVRTGRVIGKRRLGGWCDLYLAADSKLLVSEGQTLVGAETVLCRLSRDGETTTQMPVEAKISEEVAEAEASVTDAAKTVTLEEVGRSIVDEPGALEALAEEDMAEQDSATPASETDLGAEEDEPLARAPVAEAEESTSKADEAIADEVEARIEGQFEDQIDDPEDAVAELFKKLTDNEKKSS